LFRGHSGFGKSDTEGVDRHVFAGTFFSNRVTVYFD